MRKSGGGDTVEFINVFRSNKYTCRVTKNCAFKLLYDLENSLHYYPENPGNCISGIPDFKIFPGEHAPPQLQCPGAATAPPVRTNRRSYELIIRRQASDTGKTFFECEICWRVTTDYSNLNKHCRLHTGEKPFKCNECEKAFSDRSDYDFHCRTHGEKTNRTTSNLKSHSCEKFPDLEKLHRHYQEELHFYLPI